MGSATGNGGKLYPPPRPSKREAPHLPFPQPDLNPNPSPDLDMGSGAPEGVPAGEDQALAAAEGLSREEVIRRRARRTKQLFQLYRRHYWELAEEMRMKHRDYYWDLGISPVEEEGDEEAAPAAVGVEQNQRARGMGSGLGNGEDKGGGGGRERKRCGFSGCKSYAMPLTTYCHAHILSDAKQTLYKPCSYVVKSAQSGQLVCGKPVLRATVPLLCQVHFQKAQKHVSQALRRAGLGASSSSRPAPKLHVLVAEYVRQIQARRTDILISTTEDVANKDVV